MSAGAQVEQIVETARGLEPIIREHADRSEQERRLAQPVVDALKSSGILRLCRPRALGGLEADPWTAMEVFEELSRVDGSAGWCAMICGAGGAFDAFIPREGAARMYADPTAVTTGVIAPTGRATPVDGGYRVSGRWAIASACQHCDWLGGTAVVFDGDAPRMGPGGMPQTIVPLFSADAAKILDTWKTGGLRASGSHDFEVSDVFVPNAHCIQMPMLEPAHDGALFRFPFFGLLAASIASTTLGIGRAAIEELSKLAGRKTPFGMRSSLATRATTHLGVAEMEATLSSARAFLAEAVRETWETVVAGNPVDVGQRARLRLAATHATSSAAKTVTMAHELGGSSAIYSTSRLDRCFRDVHTITAHFSVARPSRELLGQVLLGQDADFTLL